jgi:methionyl aminopeptidase
MSIETEADLQGMKAAAAVVREVLDALEQATRQGVTTGELDRVAAKILASRGARSAPADVYQFPGTVLISVNEQVVHGVPGRRVIERGDVVKLDVTVSRNGYVADAARTVVVEGGSSLAQRLAACATTAFEAAMRVATAGTPVNAIGRAIDSEVRRQGFTVIRDLEGHGVGRTIHEAPRVPNFHDRHQRDILTEGLVIAVEPIICAGSGQVVEEPDRWTIRTRDRSLAAHYEHTILITQGEPLLLTA